MDKYDKHLEFLIAAFPKIGEAVCKEIFLTTAKRDIRKALFFVFQPKENIDELVEKLSQTPNNQAQNQIDILNKIFHSFCPNNSYKEVVNQLSKGKPLKIDTETLGKLQIFRRAPRKELLQKIFSICYNSENEVIVYLLNGLQPFGRELEPLWNIIDNYAKHTDIQIVKSALNLLAQIPTGVHKSILVFSKHCSDPQMRFHALSAMQQTTGLSAKLLINLFDPIIAEYRRLSMTQGNHNDLWEEYRLIRNIAQNNGLRLSIPDINLERF